jgi:transposase-like protein
MSDLSNPIFHDADKAREWLEARIWPNGPICPKCGVIDQATLMKGKTTRPGLYQCNACREPFTVTVGTLYERSKVPLNKWLAATHLIVSSKKGMSALQIGRMLGLSKKTAWFLCHRIRESLRPVDPTLIGGEGETVEMDETFVGGKDRNKHAKQRQGTRGHKGKEAVFALVERDGRVRSTHVPDVSAKTLYKEIEKQLDVRSHVKTDGWTAYKEIGWNFASHEKVDHSIGEYVRGGAHTNTIESYFAIMKRGITGTFHHVSAQHLKRYLAEFDFRYNEREKLGVNDKMRFEKAIPGIVGRRLTYRRIGERTDA